MKFSPLLMMASALAVLLPGCGSTEEPAVSPAPRSPAPRREAPEDVRFHTRADTVTALHAAEHGTVGTTGGIPQIRFMVQIGAFKGPKEASSLQAEARRRYHMPVLNDFHAGSGFYQIRIGFFETRESARTFLQRLRHDYPADYNDSWIVQLKR